MGVEEGDDTSACSEAVKGRRENERKRRGVRVCELNYRGVVVYWACSEDVRA